MDDDTHAKADPPSDSSGVGSSHPPANGDTVVTGIDTEPRTKAPELENPVQETNEQDDRSEEFEDARSELEDAKKGNKQSGDDKKPKQLTRHQKREAARKRGEEERLTEVKRKYEAKMKKEKELAEEHQKKIEERKKHKKQKGEKKNKGGLDTSEHPLKAGGNGAEGCQGEESGGGRKKNGAGGSDAGRGAAGGDKDGATGSSVLVSLLLPNNAQHLEVCVRHY